jgi:hypothetical protein
VSGFTRKRPGEGAEADEAGILHDPSFCL